MWLFLALVAVPIIEIALFIQVGGAIGTWPTLGIVVLTAIIGTMLLRAQGAMALRNVQRSLAELRDPAEPLAHGAMVLVSGVLLLTPGFFTDALGLALLLPPVRSAIWQAVRARMQVRAVAARRMDGVDPAETRPAKDVIEGEWFEEDPSTDSVPKRPTHRPSGWTKH